MLRTLAPPPCCTAFFYVARFQSLAVARASDLNSLGHEFNF